MMFKIVTSSLIVILSALVGYIISLGFDYRIKQLSAFVFSIKIMETEMNYSKSYLYDIVKKLCNSNEKVIAALYQHICSNIKNNNGKGFEDIWIESVEKTLVNSDLKEIDIRLIKDFGKRIGKMDLKNQEKIYTYFLKRFDLQIAEAREEKDKKSRVYKNIGFAVGVMVVVILI